MTTLTLSEQAADVVKAAVVSQRRLLETGRREYRQRLKALERRHGMTTKQFVRRFQAGKLHDDSVWFDWLFVHRADTELAMRLAILRGVKL